MKRKLSDDTRIIATERGIPVLASVVGAAVDSRLLGPTVAVVVLFGIFGRRSWQLTRQHRVQRVAAALTDEPGFSALLRMRGIPSAEDARREIADWFADLDRVDEAVFDCLLALLRLGRRDATERYFVRSFRRVLAECDAVLLRELRTVVEVALRHSVDDGSTVTVFDRVEEGSSERVLLAIREPDATRELFGPYPGIRNSVQLFRLLKDADVADDSHGTVHTDRTPGGDLQNHIRYDISFKAAALRKLALIVGVSLTQTAPSPSAAV